MKALTSVAVVVAGMVGLYFKVDYSGWVLFVGLCCVWSAT